MNTRQALAASCALVPDVRATTIFQLRQRLQDQLEVIRKSLDGSDFELAATHLGYAAQTARAIHENLELDSMSRCTVAEAPEETLVGELIKRAERGEADAKKAILDAAKRLTQPKRKGESRVRA